MKIGWLGWKEGTTHRKLNDTKDMILCSLWGFLHASWMRYLSHSYLCVWCVCKSISSESISDGEEWRSTGTLQGLHPNMGKNGTLEYYFLCYLWTAETTVLRNCTLYWSISKAMLQVVREPYLNMLLQFVTVFSFKLFNFWLLLSQRIREKLMYVEKICKLNIPPSYFIYNR